MGSMNLEIFTKDEGKRKIVQLHGEVDVYTAPKLKDALTPLSEQSDVEIIIDLWNVHYIDSTGLGIFIGSLKTANKSNSKLIITGTNERVRRLFEITGLDEIMEIIDTKEEV